MKKAQLERIPLNGKLYSQLRSRAAISILGAIQKSRIEKAMTLLKSGNIPIDGIPSISKGPLLGYGREAVFVHRLIPPAAPCYDLVEIWYAKSGSDRAYSPSKDSTTDSLTSRRSAVLTVEVEGRECLSR